MRRIQVRYDPPKADGLRWYRYAGYRWYCPHCDRGGRASSRSWPSPRLPKRSAFERVIASVDRHLNEWHREAHLRYLVRKMREPS